MCLSKNTRLDERESNGQIFLDIIQSNQMKDNSEYSLGISCVVKQTRTDSMVNSVSYITFLQLFHAWSVPFCCDCQPSYRRNAVLILILKLFKACYSVQEYTCVNKHMIFDNGTKKKFDQNASFIIIESVNYKKMNPTTP